MPYTENAKAVHGGRRLGAESACGVMACIDICPIRAVSTQASGLARNIQRTRIGYRMPSVRLSGASHSAASDAEMCTTGLIILERRQEFGGRWIRTWAELRFWTSLQVFV